MCGSSGNSRFGVVTKTRAGDPAELGDELPLTVAAAGDVLDHGVREAEVEGAVGEGQLAPVGADGGDPGKAAAKRSSSVWPTAVIRSGHG